MAHHKTLHLSVHNGSIRLILCVELSTFACACVALLKNKCDFSHAFGFSRMTPFKRQTKKATSLCPPTCILFEWTKIKEKRCPAPSHLPLNKQMMKQFELEKYFLYLHIFYPLCTFLFLHIPFVFFLLFFMFSFLFYLHRNFPHLLIVYLAENVRFPLTRTAYFHVCHFLLHSSLLPLFSFFVFVKRINWNLR